MTQRDSTGCITKQTMTTPCCEPDCPALAIDGSDACAAHAGLTTVDLADRIAQAVREAERSGKCAPGQAVLRELRETGHWFCRIDSDSRGVTTYERMPDVQGDLFRGAKEEA